MAKLRPSGGYRELRSFQIATIIYDATYWFCERFLDSRSRMSDQMVQAARSGRQNIAEGSRAAATSSQTELRLVNVARASLEELLLDYEDFLRQRHLKKWEPDDPEALAVRRIGQQHPTDQLIERICRMSSATRSTPNGSITRTPPFGRMPCCASSTRPTTCSTSKSQRWRRSLSKMAATANSLPLPASPNVTARSRLDSADAIPACPECGKAMVLRTAQKGKSAGKQFWGCSGYPDCKGLVDI